mmetsp:Transcript_15673/g.20114  ORF Transcript_15673/g.20114 Transcript_15673/m.20114 type:complete len:308 (-) Transcript_15673:337-1260(-)
MKMYKLGFFQEGGVFDVLDKKLSMPIFTLEIGKLEYVLSVPGCWFGLPVSAWGVLPLYVGAYQASFVSTDDAIFFTTWITLPITLLLLLYWFRSVSRDTIKNVYFATKPLLPFLVFGPPLLTKLFMKSGYSSACFVVCNWCIAEVFCHSLKITSRRMRPLICIPEIKQVHRELPSLQTILKTGETAFQSFPSGDAVGAAAFSTTLYIINSDNIIISVVPVFLCCFGRIYFHAHHLSDVIIGSSFGFLTGLLLERAIGLISFMWVHVLLSLTGFIVFHRICAKAVSFEVPEEYRTGTSIYGRDHKKTS